MSEHFATTKWSRMPSRLHDGTYDRNHTSHLNGEQVLRVSASEEFKGDPECADPEQLLVTAVSSCHMLTFLAIAEFQGFQVKSYVDEAVGVLGKTEEGGMAVTSIRLSPFVVFDGEKQPGAAALARLHSAAHRNCFIRASLRTDVQVLPHTTDCN